MGGKGGSSAPSPDKNIGKAALANVEVGKEWLAFAKDQFATGNERQKEIDALTKTVFDRQIASQDKSEARSDEQWDRYNRLFKPVEDTMVKEAMDYGSPAMQAEEAARAKADVLNNSTTQKAIAQRNAAAMGIKPGSGRYAGIDKAGEVATALASAGAQNNARINARDKGIVMRQNAANFGRGAPAIAMQSSGLGLNQGNSAVGNAMQAEGNFRANQGIMSQGYQGAMNANTSSANILNNLYQNQLSAYSTDQAAKSASASGLMSAIGTGAGLAMMA